MISKKNRITYNPKYHQKVQQDFSVVKNLYQRFRYGVIQRHVYYLTSGFRVLPKFFVIGGVRCGTTSLYHYLGQHNCMKQAVYDELGYFDDNFHLGLNWYRSLFPTKFIQKKIETQYGKFLTYDVTPFYIYNPLVIERIFKFMSDAKIIAVLRNPIDRAYSNFNDRLQQLNDTKTTFEDAINKEMDIIEKKGKDIQDDEFLVNTFYELDLARGFYAEQLRGWFDKFPKKNMLLIPSEDLSTNTNDTLSRIFEFLQIPKQEISDLTKQNKIKYPKMKDTTREILINFFRPHNEELFNMIGKRFKWDN